MGRNCRTGSVWVIVAVVLGACSAGPPSGAAPREILPAVDDTPEEQVTSQPTEDDQATDLAAALVEHLGAPGFSSRFTVSGQLVQPGGVTTRTGEGAVAGPDSQMWVVDDYSELGRAAMASFPNGPMVALGPGATQLRTMATRLVDGVMYHQDNGGHWRVVEAEDPQTVPGHVLEVLGDVTDFEVAGSEAIDGVDHVVLQPAGAVEYVAHRLAMGPPVSTDTVPGETSVVVDDEGVPQRIMLEVDIPEHDASFAVTLDLWDVGEDLTIAAPQDTWVPATSLGFETAEEFGQEPLLFEVPASWEVSEDSDDGALALTTPYGTNVVFVGYVERNADAEQALHGFATAWGMEDYEVMAADLGGFPAVRGVMNGPTWSGAVVSQVFLGDLGLVALSSGPPDTVERQLTELLDVRRTVRVRASEQGLLPGMTVGDAGLQADTLVYVEAVARVAAGDDCESADVAWTEVTGSHAQAWTEDWYVNACGDLQVHEISFVESPDGGTDFQLSNNPFRFAEATTSEMVADVLEDPEQVADWLVAQPWLVDPDHGIEEVEVASLVQSSRFHESQLYVVLLGSSLGDGFDAYFEAVSSRLGSGILLLVDPDQVAVRMHNGRYDSITFDAAFNGAMAAPTDEEFLWAFVSTLDP